MSDLRTTKVALPILASLAGLVFLPLEIAIAFTAVVIIGAFLCCECLDIRKTEQQYENRFMIPPRMPGFQTPEHKGDVSFPTQEAKRIIFSTKRIIFSHRLLEFPSQSTPQCLQNRGGFNSPRSVPIFGDPENNRWENAFPLRSFPGPPFPAAPEREQVNVRAYANSCNASNCTPKTKPLQSKPCSKTRERWCLSFRARFFSWRILLVHANMTPMARE